MRLPPSRVTFTLGGITAVVWAAVALLGRVDDAALAWGFIPARLGTAVLGPGLPVAHAMPIAPAWLTPLSASLVHGGLVHLGFNLLMLGFCGRFVEVALGGRGVLLLYVIGAYAAALAQYFVDPYSTTPMIGASGAISALLGAYALLFGERRGRLVTHRFGRSLQVAWLAAAWIGFQLLISLATVGEGAAIATTAHIGGFLAGLILARPLLRWRYRNA